jgi:hypothetical protein
MRGYQRPFNNCPEGQNMKAQGNALGKWPNKIPSPEGATYTALGTQSIALASLNSPFQGYFDGG